MTIFFIGKNISQIGSQSNVSHFDIIIYCAWTIFPPAWFLIEYVWLFPESSKVDSDQTADLKYTQELGAKIWAGVVVVITVIMFLKYGKDSFIP